MAGLHAQQVKELDLGQLHAQEEQQLEHARQLHIAQLDALKCKYNSQLQQLHVATMVKDRQLKMEEERSLARMEAKEAEVAQGCRAHVRARDLQGTPPGAAGGSGRAAGGCFRLQGQAAGATGGAAGG